MKDILAKDPTDENIIEKEYIKDLSVYISSDLTWNRQIEETVSKARLMLGWALRTFQTREVEPMITVWNSLISPHLGYCSPLWSPRPTNVGEIDLLESTQCLHQKYKRNGGQRLHPTLKYTTHI